MAKQEAATRQSVTDVSHAVSNVQTDVGGVKQDVVHTQQELASTEQQLHAAVGDLGVQSGLIATNSEQLNYLKHLGDRNYIEFTLRKGQPPSSVSISSSCSCRKRTPNIRGIRWRFFPMIGVWRRRIAIWTSHCSSTPANRQ